VTRNYGSDTSRGRGTPAQVLEHIWLVEASGEPSPELVEAVAHVHDYGTHDVPVPAMTAYHWGRRPTTARAFPRSYQDYAKALRWNKGGRGDHLAKALVLAGIDVQ
jgi:hypothetical protein